MTHRRWNFECGNVRLTLLSPWTVRTMQCDQNKTMSPAVLSACCLFVHLWNCNDLSPPHLQALPSILRSMLSLTHFGISFVSCCSVFPFMCYSKPLYTRSCEKCEWVIIKNKGLVLVSLSAILRLWNWFSVALQTLILCYICNFVPTSHYTTFIHVGNVRLHLSFLSPSYFFR